MPSVLNVALIVPFLVIAGCALDKDDHRFITDESDVDVCLLQTQLVVTAKIAPPTTSENANAKIALTPQPANTNVTESTVASAAQLWNSILEAMVTPYFRPVSASVQACITIILLNLLVMTALTIVVNRNEALTEPHVYFLQLFKALRRLSNIGAPFAVLLIGARMHLNGEGANKEEYPVWVTTCIYLVPTGILMQLLLVIMLSLVVEWDDTPFDQKLGWPSMVHPWLGKLIFHSDSSRRFFFVFQVITMLIIYGSTIGVVAGIFSEGSPSPAIMCTILLIALSSGVNLFNWLIHEVAGSPVETIQLGHGMSLSVSLYQKTAMVSLLMLTERQCAMFMDPPNGTPPDWAKICFYAMTVNIYMNVILSGYISAIGKKHEGKFAQSYYVSHSWLHVVKLLLHGMYVGIVTAIVCSIFSVHVSGGKSIATFTRAPSPTVMSVLILTYIYVGTWELLEVVNFATYVLNSGQYVQTLKFALEACTHDMAMSPLIGTLCIAVRMRALQITNDAGSPQAWAQQAMYASVFSLILYAVCGILVPVFQGGVENADATGNVNVDLKPLMGAFLMQTAKYACLFVLYLSVFALSASAFMITPETAAYGHHVQMAMGAIIKRCGDFMLILLVSLFLSSAKVIGLMVKYAIDRISVRGCTLTVDKAVISIARGFVSCSGVVVSNPYCENDTFTSKYIMKTDLLILQIDLWRLITTLGNEVSILKLAISGVHVKLEKSTLRSASNMSLVMKGTPEEQAEARKTKNSKCGNLRSLCSKPSEDSNTADIAKASGPDDEKKAEGPKVFLGKVQIDGVSASFVRSDTGTLFEAELGSLNIQDVKNGELPVAEIVNMVILSILKTIYKNTFLMKKLLGVVCSDGIGQVAQLCSPRRTSHVEEQKQPEQSVETVAASQTHPDKNDIIVWK